MANILKNPGLSGFTIRTYFTDNKGSTGTIEDPNDWEYTYFSLYPEDPNLIPQSLHQDNGFSISAGYRKWEAGYVQRGVQLRAGQRYLAKANFFPDVNFSPGTDPSVRPVQWRFWIQSGDNKVFTEWTGPGAGYKQNEELLFVFQAGENMTAEYYFKAQSTWENNACAFNISKLSLEEVAADYGGANVPVLGTGATPVSTPVSTATSTPTTSGGEMLTVKISSDDVRVITAGLREMQRVTDNEVVVAAFLRLADALDKLT